MTDREGKAAKGGERQEESCLQGKEAAALQRDTKEHRQKEIRQLSGKSWPTRLNAPLLFQFHVKYLLCSAQHSPGQLATRCSPCSSSETELYCQRLCQELRLGSKAPGWEMGLLQHDLC